MKKIFGLFFFGIIMISLVFSQQTTTLRPGGSQSAILQGTAVQLYSVAVPAGRLIAYTEGNLDTTIRVYNSEWEEIAFDDDSGNDLNARVSVRVPAGTYIIGVSGYGSGSVGPYTVYALAEAVVITNITSGRPTNAILQGTSEHVYNITVPAGMLIAYTESSLDTLMRIYNAQGQEIAYDDDSGYDLNASISVRVPAGTYTIEVRGLWSNDVGPYTLYALSEPVVYANITLGRIHSAILQGITEQFYNITVPAGRLIAYTESSLDTLMRIYNAQGEELAFDDDSGNDFNARIEIRVPAGTYTIGVRGWGSNDIGNYTLHTLLQ